MRKIDVKIKGSPYPIFIARGARARIGALIRDEVGHGGDVCVVTNTTVGPLYVGDITSSLEGAGFDVAVAEVPDGEPYKTLATISELYARFLQIGLDRKGLVLALGGGVVGDMAGFAAATYLRGVPFVQMPTTLLSMVDASVGGKTGVDLPAGKNLVGAFKQPEMVAIDPEVLLSLDPEELASGMAEVVKHGLIGDAALFEMLEREAPRDFERLVDAAVRVKVRVVERDPLEKGERATLNLGHTFGHAFELASDYTVKHGVGVGVGLVAAARMAVALGEADASLVGRVEAALVRQNLPTRLRGYRPDDVLDAMRHDKKRAKKRLRFIVPNEPGRCSILEEVPEDAVRQAVSSVLED